MTRQELRTAAPMPKTEKTIVNNPMKLYSYLVCLSGVAAYPEHTRIFRHKNIVLTDIKRVTGITDKTVKLYMYYLEMNNLIQYSGEKRFKHFDEEDYYEKNGKLSPKYRLDLIKYVSGVWQERKKEKDSIYYIPRPNPYTPIPEETLEKLQEDFNITELELKIYNLCCSYRDDCNYYGKKYKTFTFEQLRDVLNYKLENRTDAELRRALVFLSGVGLISYQTSYFNNSKGAKIPCFKIEEVNYYIGSKLNEVILEDDLISQEELNRLGERINKGLTKGSNVEENKIETEIGVTEV